MPPCCTLRGDFYESMRLSARIGSTAECDRTGADDVLQQGLDQVFELFPSQAVKVVFWHQKLPLAQHTA